MVIIFQFSNFFFWIGLCGEKCPEKFCVRCCKDDLVVDVVEGLKLSEINASQPGQQLIELDCGHPFIVDTLDGWFELGKFYSKDVDGNWEAPSPLPSELQLIKTCPTCRAPIHSVKRYGRVNYFNIVYRI